VSGSVHRGSAAPEGPDVTERETGHGGATFADARRAGAHEVAETWPQGISHRASMRISDVLAALRVEFPAITHSKLRFLEEQGLIDPVRTASGYRQYSPADVERLRFVLVEQRDRYLPLKVIKDKLAALDEGLASKDQPLIPRVVVRDGESTAPASHLTMERLAQDAGVETSVVEELVAAGLVRPDGQGRFDAWDHQIVVIASGLAEHGIGARHLRTLRAAAERHVDLVSQAVTHLRGSSTPSARARMATTAAELGELCAQLQTTWIRQGIADLS